MDLLSVVRQCHNDDPWRDHALVPLHLPDKTQIGFLPRDVEQQVRLDISSGRTTAFTIPCDRIEISLKLKSNEAISKALKEVMEDWRDRGLFESQLKGWRNELYGVYGKNGKEAFRLERSACALLGVATYGVHATAYTPDYRIWVPRRSRTKSTWPGYLDNSAAGGITAGDDPYESMVRECGEEAGLEAGLVRSVMRQTGVISYFHRTARKNANDSGYCQPEVEYTYDIPLPSDDVQLRPVDGEAESFELMEHARVMQLVRQGKFKANCAVVLIDFSIRHGLLTAENCDCDFTKLVCVLHNDLRLPGPH